MKNKSRAFSLIELSIVILIIGIIIAGVTQGSRLVNAFKLQSAQTLTKSSPVPSIKGLVFWFEPTLDESLVIQGGVDQTEEDTVISQWNDINPLTSAKYYLVDDAADETVTYKKSTGTNGLPSVHFGAEMTLYLSNAPMASDACCVNPGGNGFTVFMVHKPQQADSYLHMYNGTGANTWNYIMGNGGDLLRTFSDANIDETEAGTASTAVGEIGSFMADNNAINFYLNGASQISLATLPTIIKAGNTDNFRIFARNLFVSEIILFDRPLKTEERQTIEAYLGKKYNIGVVKSVGVVVP